jgi:hypothetical protein
VAKEATWPTAQPLLQTEADRSIGTEADRSIGHVEQELGLLQRHGPIFWQWLQVGRIHTHLPVRYTVYVSVTYLIGKGGEYQSNPVTPDTCLQTACTAPGLAGEGSGR